MGVEYRDIIAAALIEQGRPADHPVAFIEHASTDRERVVESTSGAVARGTVAVEAPAVFVIGEVVRLRIGVFAAIARRSRSVTRSAAARSRTRLHAVCGLAPPGPHQIGTACRFPPGARSNAGEQYRFHFDMTKCIGCKCCVVACNEQNGNPAAINWRRVGEIEGGSLSQHAALTISRWAATTASSRPA